MPSLDQLYDVNEYIDTKALGFSARVAQATHWESGQDVALKVLRREHIKDPGVWEQFGVEVELLELLRHTRTINQMVDCGYVADHDHERPAGGEIVSCGRNVKRFRQEMRPCWEKAWRPYIALELLSGKRCLLNLVRGADGDGRRPMRLPTEEGLALAMQLAEFLQQAHALDVLYWDHKPEHAFWDGQYLRLIDLNVSRHLGASMSANSKAVEKRKDLQHVVAGVLYTAFTGRDFRYQDQAPRATPSAPNTIEARFNGVASLDFGMDDTLLPALCELLNEFGCAPSDDLTAEVLLDSFRKLAAQIGCEAGYPVTEEARAARHEIQQGLAALREAQASIEQARQHFLQARTLHPDDRESERLYRDTGKFYRNRVLP